MLTGIGSTGFVMMVPISGGLLLAVPDSQADDLITRLKKEGVETAVRVGEVVASDKPHIRVV